MGISLCFDWSKSGVISVRFEVPALSGVLQPHSGTPESSRRAAISVRHAGIIPARRHLSGTPESLRRAAISFRRAAISFRHAGITPARRHLKSPPGGSRQDQGYVVTPECLQPLIFEQIEWGKARRVAERILYPFSLRHSENKAVKAGDS